MLSNNIDLTKTLLKEVCLQNFLSPHTTRIWCQEISINVTANRTIREQKSSQMPPIVQETIFTTMQAVRVEVYSILFSSNSRLICRKWRLFGNLQFLLTTLSNKYGNMTTKTISHLIAIPIFDVIPGVSHSMTRPETNFPIPSRLKSIHFTPKMPV